MMRGRKTIGLYRLEGNVSTGGAIIKHGSSGTSKQNGQGKQQLQKIRKGSVVVQERREML